MRIRLVVSTPGERCDVVVTAPAGTDVDAVRHPLARLLGFSPDLPWWSGRRPLPGSAAVGGPGLRPGEEVSVGAPGPVDGFGPTPLHLAVVAGPGAGAVLPLTRGVHVLGRAEACDLCLPDPEVSRRHAAVTVTTAGLTVRDLDSRNGTRRRGLAVDRDGDDLVTGDVVTVGHSALELRSGVPVPAGVRAGPAGRLFVLPPTSEPTDPAPASLTAPPEKPGRTRPRIAWFAAVVPALAAAGLAWFLHTWAFLAFAVLTPLTILGTAAGDRWSWRSARRRAAADHAAATARFDRDREALLARERSARLTTYPDLATCAAAAVGPAAPLWAREPDGGPGWTVRVGTAARPARTRVTSADGTTTSAGVLDGVPVGADLTRGALGIAGPARAALAIARAVVVQLAVAHPPGALTFVVLLSDDTDPAWDWLRWLPHPVHRFTEAGAQAAVVAELAARTGRARAARTPATAGATRTVVLADRAGALADLTGLTTVVAHGAAAGIHVVGVERAAASLPAACAAVAVTVGPTHSVLALSGAGWDTADGRPDALGPAVADQARSRWSARLARALAPLDDGSRDGGLPREVRLVDLLDVPDPETVAAHWERAAATPRPLRAVVGVDATGPAVLDLTADGPHALVAGTTGSGKSELLQTWVASLAVTHPPDDLGLLLVDYKGGAAFGACARLPHTLGLVTDLDGHLTARVLQSLDAELRRRERAFAAVGANDLAAYRRSGAGPGLPRMVVVVDEFATLAVELPDFVPGLVDVAQRGRSLGVHLVLATQRPGTVVSPAVRANTTLRIALRVTDVGESTDVVGGPEAATLDPGCPGRAVVRTGTGTGVLQTARVSGPSGRDDTTVRVHRVRPWQEPPAERPAEGGRTDLDDLVDLLDKAWARRGADGAVAPTPTWLPPLPDDLSAATLADHLVTTGSAPDPLRPAIGLRDEPTRQRQVPEQLDLVAGGTLLAAGASRSGRSGLVRSVALAAAAAGVPLAVVDGGGSAGLAALPATVAYADTRDGATLVRLVDLLAAEFAARGGVTGDPAPFVVLVDGLSTATAALDELDGGWMTDRLLGLLRAAGSVGVTVVATGDRAVLGARTASTADRLLVLRVTDPGDAAMAGLARGDLPDRWPPGRGVWAPDGVHVQLARPDPPVADVPVRPTRTALQLRPLPALAVASTGPPDGSRLRLGVGGDTAGPVEVDPWAGGGRWLVAGPPRSGRSTTLVQLGLEAAAGGAVVWWWARAHSPLTVAATTAGWVALDRDEPAPDVDVHPRHLVLLDDVDDLADSPLADSLGATLRSARPERLAVVCSGRAEELVVSYRGVVAEVRRARRGLLLRPGPGDGELVGVRTGRAVTGAPAGRGLLVADGVTVDGRPVDTGPLAVQVARPPDAGGAP